MSSLPSIPEIREILSAIARRRTNDAEKLVGRLAASMQFPTGGEDQWFERQFMTAVNDLAADVVAQRLAFGRYNVLLSFAPFNGVIKEFLAKMRQERAKNFGPDDPRVEPIAARMRDYFAARVMQVVSDYVAGRADPGQYWSEYIMRLQVYSAACGRTSVEIIGDDALHDEYIRQRHLFKATYRAELYVRANRSLSEFTSPALVGPFMALMDAVFDGDGKMNEATKKMVKEATEMMTALAQPVIEAYVEEELARIWPAQDGSLQTTEKS